MRLDKAIKVSTTKRLMLRAVIKKMSATNTRPEANI
jgi:hypothetical protein